MSMNQRTLTIMFTDMKGFSRRTSTQSRAATLDMIKRHKDLLLPVITKRGGNLIKTVGDAFLVSFESPTNAVLAGVALQETLDNHNREVSAGEQIEIRIGINTGEVVLDQGDVFGEAVNIASRIQGVSKAGEIYFSESTYLSMNKSEVPFAEIGSRTLKGIPERVKIYRVLRTREANSARRASTVSLGPVPSRRRRAAAFVLDVIFLAFLTAFLLAGEFVDWRKAVGEVGSRADELRGKLEELVGTNIGGGNLLQQQEAARFLIENLETVVFSQEPLPEEVPYRGYITEIRSLIAGVMQREEELYQKFAFCWMILFLLISIVSLGWKSRTLGKRAMGLRVCQMDGEPLSWGRSVMRTFLYILSLVPFGIGFWWGLMDSHGRAWHDKIAETRVVTEE